MVCSQNFAEVHANQSGPAHATTDERPPCRKTNDKVSDILAKHTGHSVEKVKRDLNRPRYFSPEDAVDYGLIDRVLESEDKQVRKGVSYVLFSVQLLRALLEAWPDCPR